MLHFMVYFFFFITSVAFLFWVRNSVPVNMHKVLNNKWDKYNVSLMNEMDGNSFEAIKGAFSSWQFVFWVKIKPFYIELGTINNSNDAFYCIHYLCMLPASLIRMKYSVNLPNVSYTTKQRQTKRSKGWAEGLNDCAFRLRLYSRLA